MPEEFILRKNLAQASIWGRALKSKSPLSFDLEITARCNNHCRHCYINLAQDDPQAKKDELSFAQIKKIADEAASLGAFCCLVTGGEPLLRKDFFDLYLYLKKKGFLVSVFTNATLIDSSHIELFKKYPPRNIEVTVYGVTKETYERVSRKQGSFTRFMRGVSLLLENKINLRLKTMALRSNLSEITEISRFCRQMSKEVFRFDPFLHLRYDKNIQRNNEIKSERLSPAEIVALEQSDPERWGALEKNCHKLICPEFAHFHCDHLFRCGAGNFHFSVSFNGFFRLCSSLWHPQCVYDLKKGTLIDAWRNLVPKVRQMQSKNKEFLEKCRICPINNLCLWCPAHAHLETGKLDTPVDYFCQVAHARQEALEKKLALTR